MSLERITAGRNAVTVFSKVMRLIIRSKRMGNTKEMNTSEEQRSCRYVTSADKVEAKE
jgi:hypothetical protein